MGEEQLSSIKQQYNKDYIYNNNNNNNNNNNKNNININNDMNINKLFWNLAKSTRIIII
jgi:hypothetical protein